MKLDEYVSEALLAIVRGVSRAQNDPSSNSMVGRLPASANGTDCAFDEDKNLVTFVKFDVATTVDREGGGKAGISVLGADLGLDGKAKHSVANRISFMVSVGIPGPASQKSNLRSIEAAYEAASASAIESYRSDYTGY